MRIAKPRQGRNLCRTNAPVVVSPVGATYSGRWRSYGASESNTNAVLQRCRAYGTAATRKLSPGGERGGASGGGRNASFWEAQSARHRDGCQLACGAKFVQLFPLANVQGAPHLATWPKLG